MRTIQLTLISLLLGMAPALAGADLAKSKRCYSCHAVEKDGLGPSFKAVARVYQGTDKAEAKLAEKIRKGGAEHWGANAMVPPEARGVKVSDAEARELAKWVLSQ